MALDYNKKIALYILLCTRSAYRGMLEGFATRDAQGNRGKAIPAGSAAELKQRFRKVPAPFAITSGDIDTVLASGQFGRLWVDPQTKAPQIANISTDPVVIAQALEIVYDPTDPNCPGYQGGSWVSTASIAVFPTAKPVDSAPDVVFDPAAVPAEEAQ
jgi:hypothetical protein